MNKMLLFFICATTCGAAIAEGVWRYVDDSGKVIYSNVQIKGKKGEKVEVMRYPDPPVQSAPAQAPSTPSGVAIPAEVAAALRAKGPVATPAGGLPPIPPTGLPPIPSTVGFPSVPLPQSLTEKAATELPSVQRVPEQPSPTWARPVEERADARAPTWATPARTKDRQPSWAADPFSAE